MTTYRYSSPDRAVVERVADDKSSTFIPWGEEGPLGGGEAWRQWESDGKPTPEPFVAPPPPPRVYSAAEIMQAARRWGAAGEAAIHATTEIEYAVLVAGDVPANDPALVAFLRNAGKTPADLEG